jgi:hypothetical protein
MTPLTLLLLGYLAGILSGITANLLTPLTQRLWIAWRSFSQKSQRAQIQQQIKPLQRELDQLEHFRLSQRDLYLYLFRWLLGIASLFIGSVACVVLSISTRPGLQPGFLLASLVLLISAAVSTLVMLLYAAHWTTTGTPKRIARLKADIERLTAKL